MSVKKYLTLDGLTYFLNKIKSTMADELDGKANDSEVVHKAQTETVTGEKTFKKDVKIIDLNANERPGVKFEVNGSFRTFEDAKDTLPEPDFGDFGGGTLWDGGFLADNAKIQNSMGGYVINDITFGTANYSSVIQFNNYYKVTYEDGHHSPEDVKGMLRFELAPYENVEKDHEYWSDPDLYLYAMLDGGFSGGSTILGNPRAPWSKAYIGEINCEDIKFGFGMSSIFDVLGNIRNLSYVTHYSSTALTPSSTNSNTLLDNTDNLKVGDKVIDSSGVLFSITAIDTANSTFTIGTALIDLAQDSDVVHKTGNETVGGIKTFSDSQIRIKSLSQEIGVAPSSSVIQYLEFADKNDVQHGKVGLWDYDNGTSEIQLSISDKYNNGVKDPAGTSDNSFLSFGFQPNGTKFITFNGQVNNSVIPLANDAYDLGTSSNKWSKIYGTEYYYGSNNVEFSTKFVTTDTAQTISETKTFTNTIKSKKEIELTGNRLAYILPNFSAGYSGLSLCTYDANGSVRIGTWKVDNNDNTKHVLNDSFGYLNITTGSSNSVNIVYLTPKNASKAKLGDSVNKWHEINGINPGALSLPNCNAQDTSWIGDLTIKDGSDYNLKTFTLNGWVTINIPNTAGNLVVVNNGCGQIVTNEANGITGNNCAVFIPVVANVQISILLVLQTGESVKTAIFTPCLGNV